MKESAGSSPLGSSPLVAAVERRLTTRQLGRDIRHFGETASTNDRAAEWITRGALEGALVLADRQTRGRGRLSRSWFADPGLNLTFSLVLRPRLAPSSYGLIGIAASSAVAEAMAEVAPPLDPRIKWPNDVLLGGRKACGILPEAHTTGREPHPAVVLGIGINVNQVDFPEEIKETATSVLLELGRTVDRSELLIRVLERFELLYEALQVDGGAQLRAAYTERLLWLHEQVTLHATATGRLVTGRLLGVDERGALRLQIGSEERTFHAGELSFRPPRRVRD